MNMVALLLALALAPAVPADGIEREARAIEHMLIAPCCFTQTVAVHQSQAAADVRQDVRARLTAGQTRQQILDAYVAQFGNRILAEPPAKGFSLTLYVLPVVILLGSGMLVAAIVRRFSRTQPAIAGDYPPPVDAATDAERERLEDELRDLD